MPDAWRTVRFRVTAIATVAMTAILVVAGVLLVGAQRRLLEENLRDAMVQRAAAATVPAADDDIVVVVRDGVASAAGWSRDGNDLVLTRHVGGRTVEVRGDRGDIDESTRTLAASMTIGIPVAAAALAALVWWLVGRTLRPVESIRAEVAAIGGADLGRRVAEPAGDDEIARLARTMNAMLERIERSVARQQQFVGDASHELRSPLARMRSELEVDAAHPDDADARATAASVLEEVVGLQRLVDDLLDLARVDAGTPVRRDRVDLDDVVLREAGRLRLLDGTTVDLHGVTGAQVRGDAALLGRVVANLADNAARHAAGTVTFALAERDGVAVLTVADDGPGIRPADRERVFDRFARLDDARSGATGGTGLGLAIAREIVERHGGTLVVDASEGGGARFVVTLALAQS